MSIRHRIRRALKATEPSTFTIILPDGEEARYTTEEWFEALRSTRAKGEHWLIDVARRAGSNEGPIGLLWAIDASRAQHGSQEEHHDF